ncbi:MAG: hypothetical protein FJ109_20005, partial [Deltaproteobacteria bacterium]|nr:hypothetical protein [Deltaproteobacteria bacterium]
MRVRPLLVAAALVLAAACSRPPVYRMVLPQVSAYNYFVGPDLEVGFEFEPGAIRVSLSNTGDGDLLVDWAQAGFVRPDGVAIPLVPEAVSTVQTLPSGSRSAMRLKPSQWLLPPPTLWHRRANLRYRLVPDAMFERCVPLVRVALPVKRFVGERVLSEVLQFSFQVSPGDGSP